MIQNLKDFIIIPQENNTHNVLRIRYNTGVIFTDNAKVEECFNHELRLELYYD